MPNKQINLANNVTVNVQGELNVPTPTNNVHAANKKYVDDKVGSITYWVYDSATDSLKAVFPSQS